MNQREKILALFDKFEHPKFPLRNRFVRSATYLAGCDEETGEMSRAEIGRHTETAAGGAGTVITGLAYISPEGKGLSREWGLHRDERIRDVELLAAGAHKFGSKLIVQITHDGGQRDPAVIGNTASYSPSGKKHPLRDFETKELSQEGIKKVHSDFAAAAARAKSGGADGVEIHAGHGFLLMQFLSPVINRRTDGYGGSLENRARLLYEVFSDVREAVGKDFPIWIKLSIAEGTDDGYTSADGLAVAKRLLADGADGIDVSCGVGYAGSRNMPSMIGVSAGESEAPFREYARELKKHASPDQMIILTGGLRSLNVMADLLHEGYCDLFSMSRPLIAEPDLINRWYEEDSRPSACLSCNACFNTLKYGMAECPVLRDRNEGYWDPL